MEDIFYKAGYNINTLANTDDTNAICVLKINNADGSLRWVWNASNKKPIFLKFYNVGSIRAVIFASFIKLVFFLKLQQLVFKKETLNIQKISSTLFNYKNTWAIFAGTVGPNNKAILYDGEHFIKIATTNNAAHLLENEHRTINNLTAAQMPFELPVILSKSQDALHITDISKNGNRIKKLNTNAQESLIALYKFNNTTIKVKNWDYLNGLIASFNTIQNNQIPKNIVRKIQWLINDVDPDETIDLSFAHGDFTQWNMFESGNKMAIYDWELASTNKPKGFDFFHFIFQNGVLVAQQPWTAIYDTIQEQTKNNFCKTIFNDDPTELNKYLKWYLLINCLHYLDVYATQKNWHIQINWLLNVWNQAMNMFLVNHKSDRELLVMDLFDCIHNFDYAALKFDNQTPEKISPNADIDLVITRNDNKIITAFLTNHALVTQVSVAQKSFMNAVNIIMNNGEMLSIDLIWQLKRKNLEILDAATMLQTKYTNEFGVKNVSNILTARYLALFYGLNNAEIPLKYQFYNQEFKNCSSDSDAVYKDCFKNAKNNKSKLLQLLNKQAVNLKANYFKNYIFYFIDILRNLQSAKGYIITFSGVDGAGKTTVIENIKLKIEKQLRKKVVVLRHRPSILPILSVYTKGKEQAHLDTISSLPRQGKNSSFLSSAARFCYYYLDYLLGQFVIYFKYVFQGYVVIYDRYYFDFINDSKRSNIVLPKKITTLGYRFLLKPKFNFFLFADAQIILKRKQEMNESTIIALTNDYQFLFKNLQQNTTSKVYQAINNENLESTISKIITTLLK